MSIGDGIIWQERPDELLDILTATFQRRNEMNFAWKSLVSQFMALPALRAFWPMSAVGYTAADQARDVSGNGNHLTNNNASLFIYYDNSLIPALSINGTTQYLSRADGGVGNWADIIGTEAYVGSAKRGLTLGGWFLFDTLDATTQVVMGKRTGAGANQAYNLNVVGTTDFPDFRVSSGAADHTVTGTTGTTGIITTGAWFFMVGRYTPDAAAAELKIWLNNETNTADIGAVASINDVGADFTIGATGVPGNYMDGRASMCFLCACAVSDSIISQLWEQSRSMFGR